MATTVRMAALELLQRIGRDGSYSNIVLDRALPFAGLSRKDASLATALVYGVIENRLSIDYFIGIFAKRKVSKIHPELLNILRLGLYQILYLDRIPDSAAVNESVGLAGHTGKSYAKGFVNAVLREACRRKGCLPYPERSGDGAEYLSVKYSVPAGLIRKWNVSYGPEITEGILASLKERRTYCAKVNTLLTSSAELVSVLSGQGVGTRESVVFGDMIELDSLSGLHENPAFQEGLFHVQDIASRYCCCALDPLPGQSVLDLCAAPGGKSFTCAELMRNEGKITACDIYAARLHLIKTGAERLKLGCIGVLENDASRHNPELGLFDRVLCDVPCSGLGVIRKKPEIRYRDPADYINLPELQYRILCEGASHTAAGGTLVYSTCTLNPDENESVARRFLSEHRNFTGKALPAVFNSGPGVFQKTLFPQLDHSDGFFIACFASSL